MDTIIEKRQQLIAEHFRDNIPRLWCPLLTHYRDDGTIDYGRMARHFDRIVPWVKGFLVPGSTGDGWALDDLQTLEVADFAVQLARNRDIHLLLGVLKTDVRSMLSTMSSMLGTDVRKTEQETLLAILKEKNICGFTVCPPAGRTLRQADIEAGLAEILRVGLPTALYQLPQITGNEIAAETFADIVAGYANAVFFKDSSGRDRVAMSPFDKGGVFMVRGAEGEYARWLKEAGGPYDGFLLSTANCFARELADLMEGLAGGDRKRSAEISDRLTSVVNEVFALVQALPYGNPFTNANKAIDHFFAFGPGASAKPGPILHGCVRLPDTVIEATGAVLSKYNLMPDEGYCL
jgi:dihydrodipicolinate synthase/N-acetylneuraminate lyase